MYRKRFGARMGMTLAVSFISFFVTGPTSATEPRELLKAGTVPQIRVWPSHETVRQEDISTITILISNPGPDDLDASRVETVLPNHIDNFFGFRVLGSCNNLLDYCGPGYTLSWTLRPLAAGQSAILMFPLAILEDAPAATLSGVVAVVSGTDRTSADYAVSIRADHRPLVAVNLETENAGPGEAFGGAVVVSNPTGRALSGASVILESDPGVALFDPTSGVFGRSVRFNPPLLGSGGHAALRFDARVESGTALGTTHRLRATLSWSGGEPVHGSQIVAVSRRLIELTASMYPQRVAPDRLVYVTLAVTNRSSRSVRDILLYATVPDHAQQFFDYDADGVCATPRTSYCSPGNQIGWEWDVLAPGERRTVTMPLRVEAQDPVFDFGEAPAFGANFRLGAGVRASDGLGAHATVTAPIAARNAPVAVLFDGLLKAEQAGQNVELRPVVQNLGPAALRDGTLDLVLPPNATLVSQPANATVTGRTIRWRIRRLPGRSRLSHAAIVRFASSPSAAARVRAEARIGGRVIAEDRIVSLLAPAPLEVSISAIPAAPIRGQGVTFRYTVRNASSAELRDVKLSVQVPDYIDVVTLFSGIGQLMEYRRGSLLPGATWTVELKGEVISDRWPFATDENVPGQGEVLLLRALAETADWSGSLWERMITLSTRKALGL